MTGPFVSDLTTATNCVQRKPCGGFLTPLKAEHLGGKWWKLTAPLEYHCVRTGDIITVPKGFVTDFASVPRVPVAYWLFGSRANAPAALHDYLYREGTYGRKMADLIFLDAMKSCGYSLFTRRPMYRAVRMFGWAAYKPVPGCMDYRDCKHGRNPKMCPECKNFKGGL